jgi:hypothetical protein
MPTQEVLIIKREVRLSKRDDDLMAKFATNNGCTKAAVLRKGLKVLLGLHSYLPDDEKKALGLTNLKVTP